MNQSYYSIVIAEFNKNTYYYNDKIATNYGESWTTEQSDATHYLIDSDIPRKEIATSAMREFPFSVNVRVADIVDFYDKNGQFYHQNLHIGADTIINF